MTEERKNDEVRNSEDRALDRFAELMINKISTLKEDWHKPWFTEGTLSWPKNMSGREYNGMNALMLMMECEQKGYRIPVFMTFDRIQKLNAEDPELPHLSVTRGEKSFPVFITTFTVVHDETKEKIKFDDYKQLAADEQAKYHVYPKLKVYNVFNVDQTNIAEARPEMYDILKLENLPPERKATQGMPFEFLPVDRMIEQNRWICPILPQHQDDAYYSISKKQIVVPEKTQFKDSESYYGTIFHEMVHSTGAEDQLNRLKPAPFGSAEYAREELVAELGSALIATRYGMEKHLKDDSAAYLKNWLDQLHESPEFLKTTLLDVKKASAMVTGKVDTLNQEIQAEAKQQNEAVHEQEREPEPVLEEEGSHGYHR